MNTMSAVIPKMALCRWPSVPDEGDPVSLSAIGRGGAACEVLYRRIGCEEYKTCDEAFGLQGIFL
jgi:hypothetical protein